ncbi:Ig-like domain (group 2) [Acetitomaculum ruminis DSM 5522]|uniref:Ig-like domain (Group 2) n=1 Tax=Acetitomaculum ruminis DSM 5522 TaxID=1120918 RepID=A0A1I0XX69_9FIRM|nr:Ig-like domain-containing protein [Acetitomaculum ruminis]SFB05749.1 Ig-like domain (group 2) [Acetitomaculum ruminis DSM 5522]
MKKNVTKRLTSLFLASVMAASMAPTTTLNALAKENESIVTMDEANSQTSALPGQSEASALQNTNAEENHAVKLQIAPANTTIKLFDSKNKEVTLSEPTIASNINTYDVSLKEGTYTYEGFNKDGQSIGGASITVDEKSEGKTYQFKELKFKATNSGWTVGNEYNVKVGMSSKTNYMNLSTAANDGYAHGLGLCGETFFYELAPNATLSDEGYLSFTSSVTVTYSSAAQSISGKIPQGYDYKITAPEDITVFVGQKINHYQYFTEILPVSKSTSDGTTTYIFKLADATQYNYRLSKKGALTYCDYFKMSNTLEPLNVTEDMLSGDPKTIDRDLTHNSNSNVADVFLNINEKNYLSLDKVGDTFQIVNLRNWEAIDGWANNYFMEPDYHYEVIDENGDTSTNVVKVDENGLITAVGNGTAIVKVTYDAFKCFEDLYGAIWPENTGVFVVTVGAEKADIDTGMKIHENNANNQNTTMKLAGVNVDAELDVFYYLKGEEGAKYSFTPSEGTTVELLNPTLTDTALSYNGGFSTKGVTNDNGTYTLNLTKGRNIVKLTKDGKSTYQVLSAKEVSYTIENETHPGERPKGGDTLRINFDTYYIPCNKLAGVYNMSGTVKYTSSNEKASVKSKGNQYTFASKYSYVEVALAEDIEDGTITLSNGYILESGFGSPYGDHRGISYTVGKNPNFTAGVRTAFFGQLPDVSFEVGVEKSYDITLNPTVEGALITVKNSEGTVIEPKEGTTNTYTLPCGSYSYKATKEGYEDLEGSFEVDKENVERTIDINLVKLPDLIWDGQTATPVTPSDIKVPVTIDGTSYEVDYKLYTVSYPSQLYWIATKINAGEFPSNAKIVLDADIDLGDKPWTPIGSDYDLSYAGIFDGQGHTIKNISLTIDNYADGLFGYVRGTKTTIKIDDKDVKKSLPITISNLTVEGKGTHTSGFFIAGIVGCIPEEDSVVYLENLVNKVDITSSKANNAGIVGSITNPNVYIRNCKNYGNIESTAQNSYSAGIVGDSKCLKEIKNCFNYGNVSGGSILAGIISHTIFDTETTSKDLLIENCGNYGNITTTNYTAGGIIGNGQFIERKATDIGIKIKNCFNKGNITCTHSSKGGCGGIMGEGMPHIDSCYNTGAIKGAEEVGGLVGKFYGNFLGVIGKISNSYNSGQVTATSGSYVGSVVGRFNGDPIVKNAQTNMDIVKGLISNSYVLKGCASRVSGNNYSYVSATVLSSDELKASANSISASFTKGSIIYDNIYPILTIEKYSDNEEAALVDEAIAKLGDEINLDSDVLAVKEAYDNLSDDAKALVKNLASLEEKLAKYNSLKAVQNVTTLIDAIGEVSLESKDAIDKAQTAYDALTEDEKALVTNETKLSKAKEDYKELLVKEAKEVDALIEKIGDVSLKSEKKINAAKEAYEKLSEAAKEFVEKLDILKEAEEEFAKLTKEKELNEAAKEIIKLISAIDYTDADSVTAARKAYDAASSEVKELVVNYNTLVNAESYLAKKAKEDEEAAAKEKEALEAAKKEKELNEAAKVIINLISAIDYTNADSVTAARKAYDAASSEVKALVINYNTLLNAESYLAKKAKEDEEAAAKEKEAQEAAAKEKELNEAAKVIINLISTIDYTNADSVTAARKAYDAVSSEVKALVVNYNSLLNAESYLSKKAKEDEEAAAKEKELQEAAKKEAERIAGLKEEAKKVDDLILAIGTVSLKSENAINEAFKAYDALSDEAKTYVTKYTSLNVAKLKYNVLVSGNVDGIAITLNKQSATLYTTTQKTITLKATVKGTDEKVTWKSSNPKVATVSSEGVVVAKSAGKVKITASVGAYTKTATITVKKVTVKPSKTTIKLKVGKTAKITVTSNFKGSFKWASKNKAIATVTTNGVIKARKVGTVKITVTIAGVQKVITVKVVK